MLDGTTWRTLASRATVGLAFLLQAGCDAVDDDFVVPDTSVPTETADGGLDAALGPATACSPRAETCDGIDNDCDGRADEQLGDLGACSVAGTAGVCAQGVNTCDHGKLRCVQTRKPSAETCDGQDNDCDGVTDPLNTTDCSLFGIDNDHDGRFTSFQCACAAMDGRSPVPDIDRNKVSDQLEDPNDCVPLDRTETFHDEPMPTPVGCPFAPSYDWNHDGREELRYSRRGGEYREVGATDCIAFQGFNNGAPVPHCGQAGRWLVGCTRLFGPEWTLKTQECR